MQWRLKMPNGHQGRIMYMTNQLNSLTLISSCRACAIWRDSWSSWEAAALNSQSLALIPSFLLGSFDRLRLKTGLSLNLLSPLMIMPAEAGTFVLSQNVETSVMCKEGKKGLGKSQINVSYGLLPLCIPSPSFFIMLGGTFSIRDLGTRFAPNFWTPFFCREGFGSEGEGRRSMLVCTCTGIPYTSKEAKNNANNTR
jgi:hypothetical protein